MLCHKTSFFENTPLPCYTDRVIMCACGTLLQCDHLRSLKGQQRALSQIPWKFCIYQTQQNSLLNLFIASTSNNYYLGKHTILQVISIYAVTEILYKLSVTPCQWQQGHLKVFMYISLSNQSNYGLRFNWNYYLALFLVKAYETLFTLEYNTPGPCLYNRFF